MGHRGRGPRPPCGGSGCRSRGHRPRAPCWWGWSGLPPIARSIGSCPVRTNRHETFEVAEAVDNRQPTEPVGGPGGDGAGDGVLGGVLECAGEAQHLVGVLAGGGDDRGQAHRSGGDGAGLVEHHGVDAAGGFEDLGALEEQPELGAAPGAYHQRGRGGQPERAGAGDDQHGDGGGERRGEPAAGDQPHDEGAHGQGDDDGDEHPGDAVGEALDCGLAVLGVLDQRHLGQLGVGADPGRLHDQPAAGGAPVTVSPAVTSTGTDSPVSMLASTAEAPSTTTPSAAIFSPGRVTNRSPTLS